ncbi:hypothetical protein L7F22_051310 [Adiantum nelumboides]|nr:hypothetical protein [Adiantum nelumboides]
MDGYREEGSSSQDRQPIPIVREVGEGSSQAEEAFRMQLVNDVSLFKHLMENPKFMEFLQPPIMAQQVQEHPPLSEHVEAHFQSRSTWKEKGKAKEFDEWKDQRKLAAKITQNLEKKKPKVPECSEARLIQRIPIGVKEAFLLETQDVGTAAVPVDSSENSSNSKNEPDEIEAEAMTVEVSQIKDDEVSVIQLQLDYKNRKQWEPLSGVILDGGAGVNIIGEHMKDKMDIINFKPAPFKVRMADQRIVQPSGLMENLHIKGEQGAPAAKVRVREDKMQSGLCLTVGAKQQPRRIAWRYGLYGCIQDTSDDVDAFDVDPYVFDVNLDKDYDFGDAYSEGVLDDDQSMIAIGDRVCYDDAMEKEIDAIFVIHVEFSNIELQRWLAPRRKIWSLWIRLMVSSKEEDMELMDPLDDELMMLLDEALEEFVPTREASHVVFMVSNEVMDIMQFNDSLMHIDI